MKDERITLEGTMCANTNQIRRIAGTAQVLGLPYALDFRVNSLLDAGGIHVLSIDKMVRRQHGVIIRAACWLKLTDLRPETPVPALLSIRLNDWMRLQPMGKPILNAKGTMVHESSLAKERLASRKGVGRFLESEIQVGEMLPDDLSPDWADPEQPAEAAPAGFTRIGKGQE